MDFYIYRNFTAENLFKDFKAEYSGYGDISFVPENCNSYIWFYLPSINMNYQELSLEVQDFQTRFELLLSKIPKDKTIIALTAEVFFNLKGINSSFDLTSILGDYNKYLRTSNELGLPGLWKRLHIEMWEMQGGVLLLKRVPKGSMV